MSVFIIRRLLQSSLVIVAMSLIVFLSVNVIGNPVDILINPEFDQEEMDRAIKALGLDLPLWQQYLHFLKNALQGDFGKSFVFGESALKLIIQRVPATLELAFTALILSILVGLPLGLFAGLKPESPVSKTIMGGSILGFSLPTFWVGIMMIMVFAVLVRPSAVLTENTLFFFLQSTTSPSVSSAPHCFACFMPLATSLLPSIPSGKPK